MEFNLFKKSAKVIVTSVNLKWKGSVHSLGAIKVKGQTFDVKIPFQNKPQDDFNLDFLKTQKKPPVVVNGIVVNEPFKLISVTPTPPVKIEEGEKIEFKVKAEAPSYSYEGPMNVDIMSDNSDMAHIEITMVVVKTYGKSVDMEQKQTIMDVTKGQIIKQNLHLYGAVDFGTEVKQIKVTAPFVFVSSDPKLPFKIDNKTGYLIDIYVQAPQENYGGPLEVFLG